MSYAVIAPDDLEPTPEYPCDRRSVTQAADLATLAVSRYRLAPGEDLARTYHYHDQREECFLVCAGSLSVETPEKTFTVPAGEVFVAGPQSPIRPYNPATASEPVVVFGVGAPRHDPAHEYRPDD